MPYPWRICVSAIAGGVVGAGIYIPLSAWLADQSGLLGELQGLSWNLVPGLIIAGGLLGWWWAAKSQR